MGFSGIASGPLVRSSFKAGLLLRKTRDTESSETMPGAYVYVDRHENDTPTPLNGGVY